MKEKKIAIIGAGGFVGVNLIEHLLSSTDFTVLALTPRPQKLIEKFAGNERFSAEKSDVFDYKMVKKQLKGVHTAFYFVHMLASKEKDFYSLEAKAAKVFGRAAKDAGVSRVIYLGALASDKDNLSEHMASRHNTGDVLRKHFPRVIEFRASMVVGEGSISYELATRIVRRLPVVTLPSYWANTMIQPICLKDVLKYLTASVEADISKNEIVEIGGPETMSYEEFMSRYAKFRGWRRFFIRLPYLPEWLAGLGLRILVFGKQVRTGRRLIESLRIPMLVESKRAGELFPKVTPANVDEALEYILRKENDKSEI